MAKPAGHRLIVTVRHARISEDAVCHAFLQGTDDDWGRLEVHVGHPHGQYVILRSRVPLVGTCAAALGERVKLITHNTDSCFFIYASLSDNRPESLHVCR